jgi:hypothetical protein
MASDYVGFNNADLQPGYPSIDIGNGKVTVATTITFDTFFGSVLNLPQTTANAIATAGCYSPCYTEGVLPIVWTCATDDDPPGSEDTVRCDDLPIIIARKNAYERTPPYPAPYSDSCEEVSNGYLCDELTIIKDNIDVDDLLVCAPAGEVPGEFELDCDLDDDGKNDYISAENRGWSDLDGNSGYSCPLDPTSEGGPPELSDWIENGYRCGLHTHTWVGDQSGDPVPIYNAMEKWAVDRYNFLPVFTKPPCKGNPDPDENPGSGCLWHPDEDIVHKFTSAAPQTKYYHIEEFAVVWVTCVQTKSGDCPAATEFQVQNPDKVPNQYRAIEGYFISNYVPGSYGKCEFDPNAAFNVYLDE